MTTSVIRRAPRSGPVNLRLVRILADKMLAELDLSDAELSILLTDDAGIRVLNRTHRGKDSPTDVLAFPLDEAPRHVRGRSPAATTAGDEETRLLGDVVVSLDTAERQARSRRRELLAEIRFLLAHGILHLIGYDHGTRPQKKRMDAACRRLVRAAELPAQMPGHASSSSKGRRRPRKKLAKV